MNKIATALLAVSISLLPLTSSAEPFEEEGTLLCAIIQVIECGDSGDCHSVQPAEAGIPRFLKINFGKKVISATEESRIKRMTPIENIRHAEGKIILQGAENGRGWTIVISKQTGRMSATVSDHQVGFIVFGASTKL